MQSLVKICSTLNKYFATVLLLTMVGFVSGNTFLRYFFSSGIIITEELVRYLFMWATYMGVVSVWYQRQHIRVTTISDRLTPRGKIKMYMVFNVVSFFVLLVLFYGCVQYYEDTTTVGQVTGIPYRIMVLAMLVGTLLCAVISIGQLKQDFDMLKLDDTTLERLDKEANAVEAIPDEEDAKDSKAEEKKE